MELQDKNDELSENNGAELYKSWEFLAWEPARFRYLQHISTMFNLANKLSFAFFVLLVISALGNDAVARRGEHARFEVDVSI